MPDVKGRHDILKVHLKKVQVAEGMPILIPFILWVKLNRRLTNTSLCFLNFVTVLLYPLHCLQNDNSLPSHCRCCIYRRFTVLHLKRWVTAFRSNYFLNLRTSFHRVWCLSPPAVSFCRNRCRSACKRNCWFLRYEGQKILSNLICSRALENRFPDFISSSKYVELGQFETVVQTPRRILLNSDSAHSIDVIL